MSVLKKKRISKKNKSAWRKTDIQDVEDFLEEQRQEERIGTFADKPDEELFTIQTTPEERKPRTLTEKQKRKLNAITKPLRANAELLNTSKVQDPIAKRNIVKQKKNGRNVIAEVLNPTKASHYQANKDRQLYYEKLEARQALRNDINKKLQITKDIWVDEDFRDKLPGLKDDKGWITRSLSLHVIGNVGNKVVKVHDSLRHKTTKANKFEAPHPGMSYNPSLADYNDLLLKVVEREKKIIKEKEHLKRVTTDMFCNVTPEERDRRRLAEMSVGIDDANNNNNDNDHHDGDNEEQENHKPNKRTTKSKKIIITSGENANITVSKPVKNVKKSKQARRKELKQKQLQRITQEKRALKKQIADLNRIKSITSDVVAEVQKLKALKKHRKKVAFKKKYEPKRLGRNKFVEPDLDVNSPEDLTSSLRTVKTESNLLTDRFKRFQKRNMLPTTVLAMRKKAKIKRFVRKSHMPPGVSYEELRQQRKEAAKTAKDVIKV